MGLVQADFRVGKVTGCASGPYQEVAEFLRILGQTIPYRATKNQPGVVRLAAQQKAVNALLDVPECRHTLQDVVDQVAGRHVPARYNGGANRQYQSLAYAVRLARAQIERQLSKRFVLQRRGRQIVYHLASDDGGGGGRKTT